MVLLLLALDNRLTVRRYRIETEKVTEPIRILVVSDLHSCAYGENQRELLAAVAAEEPDLVLLPGDIVDDVLPEDNAWTVLEALAEKWPCCYVTGNHEWWSGEAERICRETDPSRNMEGLYLKVEEGGQVALRLKYVRASFAQCVDNSGTHWIDRPILPNQLCVPVEQLFAPRLDGGEG